MSKSMEALKRFICEEEGTEVVEWALVGGLVVAVGAAVFTTMGTKAKELLNNVLVALGGTAV